MVSADIYNTAGGPTVLVAEIETGTCYRASAYATETDYGVVLAACWPGIWSRPESVRQPEDRRSTGGNDAAAGCWTPRTPRRTPSRLRRSWG